MYKICLKYFFILCFSFYIFLLFTLPSQFYKFGLFEVVGDIFPAIDIILIYYFSTYKTVKYWMLFLIGIILDQLYQLPVGSSSLVLILSNLILVYTQKWFILKEYTTNILIFCFYAFLVIGSRYIVFVSNYKYNFEGISFYFYYFSTIVSYPIVKSLIYDR